MQIGVPPTSIVGLYSCPYNNIVNTHWWNTQKSGGCIVEQATHFVDLIRHLSGADIVPESIQATAVGPDMRLRQMPPHPQAEHTVQQHLHTFQGVCAQAHGTPRLCWLWLCFAVIHLCSGLVLDVLLRKGRHMGVRSHACMCHGLVNSNSGLLHHTASVVQ